MTTDSRFNDGKDADALRTIGEVAKALGIKQHVLRYWEQQFPMLSPLKRSGGRRYYRVEDIRTLDMIARLVSREGYTLKGARQAMEGGASAPKPTAHAAPGSGLSSSSSTPLPPVADDQDVIPQLRAIRDRLAAALN